MFALVLAASAQTAYRKAVSILGDSYSTFLNYTTPDTNAYWYRDTRFKNNDVTKVEETWWHMLISRMGYRLDTNNSYSGSTICNTGYGKKDYTHESFITRMKNLGNPDVLFIFGGTNDDWAKSPVGDFKYEGWTKQELYSFRPAMAWMLHYVTRRYINTEIYFILNSDLGETVTNSAKEICQHYGVPCIVLSLDAEDKIASHPSVKGMKSIADQVEAFIKK